MENIAEKPVLYTKKAIILFSIFFSVFFGALLFISNLNTLNRKIASWKVLFCSMLYLFLINKALLYLGLNLVVFIPLFSLIGGLFITRVWWKKEIGAIDFQAKSILMPLITFISLLLVVVLLFFITK